MQFVCPIVILFTALICGTALICATEESNAEDAVATQSGFSSLFNGKDLAGWECDSRFWRVKNGTIIGQTTEDNKATHNTFLIRRGEEYGNFELRFSYQVTGFNSGVQYRSVEKDDYVVNGYQADFEDTWHDDGKTDKFSGMFFEENGRMFLAQRGEAVIVRPAPEGEKSPTIEVVAKIGDQAELEKVIRRDGWNDYVVIANGFQFTHIINGRVIAMGWDEDPSKRRSSGVFAFQLHSGPPMQIQLKNIRVRKLP